MRMCDKKRVALNSPMFLLVMTCTPFFLVERLIKSYKDFNGGIFH